MAQEGNRSNVGRTLVQPPICRQFQRWGNCRFGKECRYIHTNGGSTQRGRETAAITIESAGNEVKNVEPKRSVDFRYLKTRLCNRWKRDGRCPYGSRCQFAHGEGELRAVGCSNPAVSLSSAGISAPAENVASNETVSIAGISAPAENNETGSIAGISAPAEVASNETGSSHPFKRRFKWNDVHKIKGIYGDWIDEL